MSKPAAPKWTFAARLRRHAFTWRAQRAVQQVRETTAKIEKATKAFRPISR